jgi:C-terminal processing protease CtpA/Prc
MADTIAALKQADGNRTPERTPSSALVTPTVSGSPLQHVARARSNDVPLVLEVMEAEEAEDQPLAQGMAERARSHLEMTANEAEAGAINATGDVLQELTVAMAKNGQRLGMSIAGGADDRVQPDDTRIYITAILEEGAAVADGRLRTGDVILAVDGHDVRNVPHGEAVQRLSEAADPVVLIIGRYNDEVGGWSTAGGLYRYTTRIVHNMCCSLTRP